MTRQEEARAKAQALLDEIRTMTEDQKRLRMAKWLVASANADRFPWQWMLFVALMLAPIMTGAVYRLFSCPGAP